ncbi:MEDS domain-containing protein [Ectothiorhodospiraceae bacterium 2226]|nr:MEDS domain-containing protein [Ectothiorhodospiraceae bacterium 2226]
MGGCSDSRRIEDLHRGQHACLLYGEGDDPIQMVAPFLAAGLHRTNERSVFVVGEHGADPVRARLTELGIDVRGAEARGALVLVDRWEVSFPNGSFDPVAMIGYVRQAINDALHAGYDGLRVVAEMTWALQMGVGHNKLIHYEALGNDLYPGEPLVAVCLYDQTRFPAGVCHDALRVHPVVALEDQTYPNLYYEPPQAVIEGTEAAERVQWMVSQLRRQGELERERAALAEERAARAEAEAALAAKDEMLQMLGHELRGPLAGVMGFAEAALVTLRRSAAAQDDQLHSALQGILRQSDKQARLIEHLLDAARLAEGALPIDPEPCDLEALVRDCVDAAQAAAPTHRIRLRAHAAPPTLVDRLRIEQAMTNLLDNAIKFSPSGTAIEVDLVGEQDYVLISVRDYGPGIPPAAREQVFERYKRLHPEKSGLGLGLHLCRAAIRMHGGDIAVHTPEDGRGTRFVIRLPLAPAQPAASTAP